MYNVLHIDLFLDGDVYVPENLVVPELVESFADISLISGKSHLVNVQNVNSKCIGENQLELVERGSRELFQFNRYNGYNQTERSWFGLDPQIGDSNDSVLVKQGRLGLSTSYTHESKGCSNSNDKYYVQKKI